MQFTEDLTDPMAVIQSNTIVLNPQKVRSGDSITVGRYKLNLHPLRGFWGTKLQIRVEFLGKKCSLQKP